MAYRAKELTLENINRVFFMIQKDLVKVSSTTLPSGQQATTVDLSPITGSLDQIIAKVGFLEESDTQIKSDMLTKADKTNTINAFYIGNNPVLDGTDLLLGNGEQDTVYDAVKAAQSILNIIGSANTYATLPDPETVPSGGVYVVLQDETHNNNQALYRITSAATWMFSGLFSINLSIYYTKGEANALYEKNSQDDQAYTDREIALEVINRNSAISEEHKIITGETANSISESETSIKKQMIELIGFSLSNYVPNTRQVNGKALYTDIIINTHDIPFRDLTLNQFLSLMTGSLLYKGSVETEADLPDPVGIQNGVVYNVLDTMSLMLASEGTWKYFGKIAINLADYYSKEETYSRGETDNNIGKAKGEVTDELHQWVIQLQADIVTAQVNAETASNGYTDNRIDNDIVPMLRQETENAVAVLKTWTDTNKVDKTLNIPFVSYVTFTPDADSVLLTLKRYYLDTSGNDSPVTMPMVTTAAAGFMPASDHNAIGVLQTKVEALEAAGVYVGQSFKTYADMMSTPIDPNWTVNDFTFVQDDESQEDHATEYILVYENDTLVWKFARFDDIDIPSFNQSTGGILFPSSEDGHIDGEPEKNTGIVSGWATLKNRVSATESGIVSLGVRLDTEVAVTAAIADNAVTLAQGKNATVIANAVNLANTTYVSNAISAHAAIKGTYTNILGHVFIAANPVAVNIDSNGALYHYSGEGYEHIPSGGTNGQALKKSSQWGTYAWSSLNEVPTGGTTGQYLRKAASGYEWQNLEALRTVPTGGTQGQALLKGADAGYGWESIRTVPDGGNEGQFLRQDNTWASVLSHFIFIHASYNSTYNYILENAENFRIIFIYSDNNDYKLRVTNNTTNTMAYLIMSNNSYPSSGYVSVGNNITFPMDGWASNPMIVFLKKVG
ncbi:MAG: motile sperm domain-containing protein [Treponema sp.]|jgi:hypothetical protein|nr:motile sperm domain-containing protein [Treponema sp.]